MTMEVSVAVVVHRIARMPTPCACPGLCDACHLKINEHVEIMLEDRALQAFAAVSQEHRLRIVRSLVEAGPMGLLAGVLGDALKAGSSKMSFHLSHPEQAGLVRSRRDGRQIIYAIEIAALSDLIAFLLNDCCGGRPEICGPAIATAAHCAPNKATDA